MKKDNPIPNKTLSEQSASSLNSSQLSDARSFSSLPTTVSVGRKLAVDFENTNFWADELFSKQNFAHLSNIKCDQFGQEFTGFVKDISVDDKIKLVNLLVFFLADHERISSDLENPDDELSNIFIWIIQESGVKIADLPYFKINGRNLFHYAAEESNLGLLGFLSRWAYTSKQVYEMVISEDSFVKTPFLIATEAYTEDPCPNNLEVLDFLAKTLLTFKPKPDFLALQGKLIFASLAEFDNQTAYQVCLAEQATLSIFFQK